MAKSKQEVSEQPFVPLRDMVVFPQMVVPLFVGRAASIRALEEALDEQRLVALATQRDSQTSVPLLKDLHTTGALGLIVQLLRLPDGTVKVLIEGKKRIEIQKVWVTESGSQRATVGVLQEASDTSPESRALVRSTRDSFETYAKLNKRIGPEMIASLQNEEDAARLSDIIAANIVTKLDKRQALLETRGARARLEKLCELMHAEVEILQLEKRIRSRVKRQMERNQKEYYLHEQINAIHKELGERDETRSEFDEIADKIESVGLSDEARQRVKKELGRLKLMSPMAPEATVVRNYIDWVLSLPWSSKTEAQLDIADAERILDEDHFGLKKVKERIIEYLAVQSLVGKLKGPILCFVGPPGVGKTSLGRSIARATARSFVRLSLGGVRDEAEIRGHRRTYIGSLPGKIIQRLKKAGSGNPVFLLDEVDKMLGDFRGDPASALLEVLDPEQNHAFSDHYLDLDYDLSDVLFITTANNLHGIPIPLRDRMEVIEIPGYTDKEKLEIARRYLIPRQRRDNGLQGCNVEIADDAVLDLIHRHTREAGVRNLERAVATICRKLARERVQKPRKRKFRVSGKTVGRYVGIPRFGDGDGARGCDEIGMANGLAMTAHGGELLQTEVIVVPGKGTLALTGKLGDVMQESAHAALSYLRSRAVSLGLDSDFHQRVDIHVHCPEGAIPKDGPSAGITIAAAMVSALLRIPLRNDVAMTGEITLRGRVLRIGGLREKLLAAQRCEIGTVLIPWHNKRELEEVASEELEGLQVRPVQHMDDVLRCVLRLDDPKAFLAQPTELIDWRLTTTQPSPRTH